MTNGRVNRFRAALPADSDYQALPRTEAEPEPPAPERLAGDDALDWQIDPDRLAYALVVKNSATAIRQQFGGGTTGAMRVRDYANLPKRRIRYWRQFKAKEAAV